MELMERERRFVAALQYGLPLVERPYYVIGAAANMLEDDVLQTLTRMTEQGLIARFGIILRHRKLGYRANAMVVWDVPDEWVVEAGERLAASADVTLCYQRQKQLPYWPYNLFCMIHGRERQAVLERVRVLAILCGLTKTPHAVLFSSRCFKQRGARYMFSV